MSTGYDLYSPVKPETGSFLDSISKVVEGRLSTGEKTERVEEIIAQKHDAEYALLTSSGTQAFFLLLWAVIEAKKINRFVIQDFTWRSTKDIVEFLASLVDKPPKYIDVDRETWIADPEYLGKNDLFIPTMTFGNVKTFDHKKTIYDSAHCFPTNLGARGLGEIISFSPAKTVTGTEGGAIITNHEKIYDFARQKRRFHGRPSELCATYLLESINNMGEYLMSKRLMVYKRYLQTLSNLLAPQKTAETHCHCEHAFVSPKANEIREKLSEICPVRTRYKPTLPHQNENSRSIYDSIVILPHLKAEDQSKVIRKLKEVQN